MIRLKSITAALIALVLLLAGGALAENLLVNADFSLINAAGDPEFWDTDAYIYTNSQFRMTEDGPMIYSFSPNDARWTQSVEVKPSTGYRLTALIKAEQCDVAGRGANISVLSTYSYSESVYDTDGEWQEVELYGVTGSDQTEMVVCLRLGGYSGDCTGKAWFRDVTLTECDAPKGYTAVSFSTFAPSSGRKQTVEISEPELPDRNTETWVLMAFIGLLMYIAGITAVQRLPKQPDAAMERPGFRYASLGLVMLAALAARMYIAAKTHGYAVDINCFICWGERVVDKGFGLYADGYFCDYPPVYMLLLGLISLIRRILGIAYFSQAHIVLVKLIPMLADIGGAMLVYGIFRRKAGHLRALLLSCAIALSPAFMADSAAWGQVDSLLALGLALTVYFAADSKWHIALPAYALTLLIKPQALLFGPVGLIACVIDVIKNRRLIKSALIGLAAALAGVYVISLPFALCAGAEGGFTAPIAWILEKLLGATQGYRYITVNACNLYSLLNLNWHQMQGGTATFAWIMFGVSYAVCAVMYLVKRDVKALPLTGALLMTLLFSFAPMMHERYMFPVLLLTALAYTYHSDVRLLVFLAVSTAAQFINIILPLEWGMTVGFETYGHLQASEQTLNAVISAVNVLGALFLLYTAFDILVCGHVIRLRRAGSGVAGLKARAEEPSSYKLNITRFEALTVAAVTLIYGVFTFINLGTTNSPESFYKSVDYNEQIVIDLGEIRTYRMTYFGGIADCPFTVELSNDGEHWTEENYAEYAAGDMYRWMWYVPKAYSGGQFANAVYDRSRYINTGEGGAKVTYAGGSNTYPVQTSRYLRLTVKGIELVLNEMAFIDVENECLFPVASVTGSVPDNGYEKLFDEQEKVALTPSYLNGMYFDEIYHARTAYELLHGYGEHKILEWSHPHLGKLIIAVGIKLFGMTPFGWRSAGAFVGTLMLPLMYLLAKQLTGKKRLSIAAMLLLTFDSMHFTQSRIATVDVYAVFFIMLMYLFMLRYCKMNLHREKLSRTLVPLGLSGLSMGLGIASKWICIYAAAGLALLFFISIFRRFNEYLYLRKAEPEGAAAAQFPKKLIITAVFCVVMFIIVPALIYYYSYLPHFAPSGGLTVKKVIALQEQMFNYHAGLGGDTHLFRSPWYEWPLIVKPMWYYSSDVAVTGYGVVSSISCMGNPAVWWTGAVCLVVCLIALCARKKPGYALLFIAIGFASQFLPWVLVPRSTFIYHYFASVPFIILATICAFDMLSRFDDRITKYGLTGLVIAAFLLFAMFYPIESGLPCAYSYAMKLRWFKWYNFQLQ